MTSVCHIGFGYYPGTGLTAMYEYSRCEARQGLDVYVVGLTRSDSTVPEAIDGVRLFPFPAQSRSARSPEKMSFFWHTRKVLSTLSCDIVHVYSNLGMFLLPLLKGRSQRGSIWIYDIRSGPVHPGLSGWIGRKDLVLESRFFDAVFCQSEGTREMLFGENREDIFLARQGADMNLFRPMRQTRARESLNLPEGETVLVFVSTLHPTRRTEVLLEAFQLVRRESRRPVRLMIVGDGPDFERLCELARTMRLTSQVTFTGFVKLWEVPRYLAAADIGLAYVPITAEYGPQPPVKTVEMLACGLPVIATDTRGNRHFIRDGFNGVLCNDHPWALATAITDLMDDNLRQERLRAVARESVRPYHWEKIVRDGILPQYRGLLSDLR